MSLYNNNYSLYIIYLYIKFIVIFYFFERYMNGLYYYLLKISRKNINNNVFLLYFIYYIYLCYYLYFYSYFSESRSFFLILLLL